MIFWKWSNGTINLKSSIQENIKYDIEEKQSSENEIVIDYNKIQALSKIQDVLPLDNIYKKFKSFNCNCVSIKNGHNFNSLFKGIMKIKKNKKPTVLIIDTIKGKGVKEFENDPVWHARQLAGKEIGIAKKRLKL